MKLRELIPDLLRIARQAGNAILDIYQRDDFGITEKKDHSPLTEADRAANNIICNGLEKLPLVYPVISEENKQTDFSVRKYWRRCWLVDPLDGTKEFIQRNGDFTVNIALVENGIAVLGVVSIPAAREVYWAVKGQGAFCEKNGKRQKIHAARFKTTDPKLKIVASRSHLDQETQKYIDQFDQPQIISRGSALKFLLLAQGEAHVYPRLAPTMEWDTAAAQAVLEEAGGKVLVHATGQPLHYNRENLRNPAFIALGNAS
ncbi:MAG TPA: 3'(2'),5'-bisphosphate nucleotidase [Bacteroidetes bacterium]|nr:3'(2'),5'-bisphosphate nucleotidase [Bacteroidota bacterium]